MLELGLPDTEDPPLGDLGDRIRDQVASSDRGRLASYGNQPRLMNSLLGAFGRRRTGVVRLPPWWPARGRGG